MVVSWIELRVEVRENINRLIYLCFYGILKYFLSDVGVGFLTLLSVYCLVCLCTLKWFGFCVVSNVT